MSSKKAKKPPSGTFGSIIKVIIMNIIMIANNIMSSQGRSPKIIVSGIISTRHHSDINP
jgi:hypothetical protein